MTSIDPRYAGTANNGFVQKPVERKVDGYSRSKEQTAEGRKDLIDPTSPYHRESNFNRNAGIV